MSIVFHFNSIDPRQRATFAVAGLAEAAAHIEQNFDLRDFSFDEDGDDPASIPRILADLKAGSAVRLHELTGVTTNEQVDIIPT